jgi:hypothetical protein
MSTIINTRSPYYISVGSDPLSSVEIGLYIWTGLVGARPASPEYTITKSEIDNDNYVIFEISELIRDYLYTEYYTEAVDAVWVQYYYKIDGGSPTFPAALLAIDGYGYFEEGVNPRESSNPAILSSVPSITPQLLQDNTTVYFIKGQDIKIPIFAESLATITYSTGGASSYWEAVDDFWDVYDVSWATTATTITITDDGDTDQKIQYVNITGTDNLNDGDTITITNGVYSDTTIITLREICELKYTPYRVVFYNKYGALQDIWFNKKSTETLNVTSNNYKRNIIDLSTSSPTYNTYKHANRRFDVVANETIQLSTGYVDESINEPIKQLLMSESVWIDNGTDVYPVNINSSSLQIKKSVNEKLIAYTLDFNYAFDKIQNVR